MLIDKIMSYCDSEYKNAHRNVRCVGCSHTGECTQKCKDCLEEIHYPRRHPDGKRSYDCPHLINFYVCDYTYKYTTEIYRLMQKSSMLKQLPQYHIFSIGCGACPDLMAFEAYLLNNGFDKTIEYRGIDKNPLWEPIHNQIQQYDTGEIAYINLATEDVFAFLEQFSVGDINVLVLQYVISALYTSGGAASIDRLFDLIIESIVKERDKTEPFVILINDVNSRNLGRDLFLDLQTKMQAVGINGSCSRFYFDKNIQFEGQRYGTKHEKSSAMPPQKVEKYSDYEPWQFCTSAQLVIEIGGNEE